MTLVITDISKHGIAMVADNAVTEQYVLPSGASTARVLTGVEKLQVITSLRAGVAAWGLGSVPSGPQAISTDVWLADFIQRHLSVASLEDFARELTDELQSAVGSVSQPMGFHLAGYVDTAEGLLPTFYHIRNNDGPVNALQLHEFCIGQDRPPWRPGDEIYITRNGDYAAYAALFQGVETMQPYIRQEVGLTIPHPSLEGRLAYHAAWVRFISDLYASSQLLRTIGRHVAAVGITPDGTIRHFA